MTSKNFYFKSLLRYQMTGRLWAVALAVLGCLTGLLLPVLVTQQGYQNELRWIVSEDGPQAAQLALERAQRQIVTLLSFECPLIKLALLVLAILCGVAMFRYLHDRRQVDFYHALPISRGKLFALNYVTGILLVLPVYLVVLAITLAYTAATGLAGQLTGAVIAQSVLGNIAYFLLNYTVAVLCTILTGNTIITVLLGMWVQFGIPALAAVVQFYQTVFYKTFDSATPLVENLMVYGSPLVNYLGTTGDGEWPSFLIDMYSTTIPEGMSVLVYPLLLTVLLGILSYVMFVRRKSENAGMAIAFRPLKLPLKCFMCLCMGLGFGLLFIALFGSYGGWMWFGVVLGTVLCHMIVEIIYEFDFKALLRHWVHMIALVAVTAALLMGIKCDVLGYDSYVPGIEDIASVSLACSGYDMSENYVNKNENQLTDAESIALVHEIAELSVANNNNQDEEDGSQIYTVYYTLKNGDHVSRCYTNVAASVVEEQMVQFFTREAYLKQYSSIQLAKLPETAEQGTPQMEVRNSLTAGRSLPQAVMVDRSDIQAVIDQLRADQIAHAKAHLTEYPVLLLDLYNNWSERQEEGVISSATWPVYPSDTQTIALIEQLTGVKPVQLSHENVQSIEITAYTDEEYQEFCRQYDGGREQMFMDAHTITVTDPAVIDALTQNAITQGMVNWSGNWTRTASYKKTLSIAALIHVNPGDSTTEMTDLYYAEGEMPEELIDQLTEQIG